MFELSKVEHLLVRKAMVGHLRHADEDLARRVAFARTAADRQGERHAYGSVVVILIADGSDGAPSSRRLTKPQPMQALL